MENGTAAPPKQVDAPVLANEEQAQAGSTIEAPKASEAAPANEEGTSKKRKRHEDETAEERAERKRRKKEKREKRKSDNVELDEASD